jgi:uncharacterized membrane protein YebE (DUF533 family)
MLKKRTILAGLAALAFAGNAWAQSQEQPPPETQQAQQAQSQPATNQRGTEEAPFIVKIMPATESKPDAHEDAKARDEKAENDRQLVIATWVLAVIAFLQFVALGFQAFYVARVIASPTKTPSHESIRSNSC